VVGPHAEAIATFPKPFNIKFGKETVDNVENVGVREI
jgi:hypothetical protein